MLVIPVSHPEPAQTENTQDTSITDSLGNTVTLPENARVVSLYGSFAECWMLSGGSLVGVTQDVLDDRSFSLSDDVEAVGTVEASQPGKDRCSES